MCMYLQVCACACVVVGGNLVGESVLVVGQHVPGHQAGLHLRPDPAELLLQLQQRQALLQRHAENKAGGQRGRQGSEGCHL